MTVGSTGEGATRPAGRRMPVAGTAGGVGTTTVTALAFGGLRDAAGGAPTLLDHTAGTLGLRLTDGDEVRRRDDRWWLHDLGAFAHDPRRCGLDEPATVLTVVSAATPVGIELARAAVAAQERAHGATGLSRTVVVLAGVFGRYRLGAAVAALRETELRGVLLLPRDPALAAGGRIPTTRLSRATRRTVDELCALLTTGRRAQPDSWSWSTDDPVHTGQHSAG